MRRLKLRTGPMSANRSRREQLVRRTATGTRLRLERLEGRFMLAAEFGEQNTISTAANGAASVFAADVDSDGDIDVLSASEMDNKIAWYENAGSPGAPLFTERIISTLANMALSVFAADVDGDGDTDVLSASFGDNKIAWYENNGSQSFTARTISADANSVISVFAVDVDSDGDTDVLSASLGRITWWENDGTPAVGAWTREHTISTAAHFGWSVFAADVDSDGDIDVLSASEMDNTIAWYENDGTPAVGAWVERTISAAANGARSVFAADVDGDGDSDVLSASRDDDTIAWYENDGSPADGGFTARTISTTADGAASVFAADVDGDGDTDVLSASFYDDRVAWYENDGSPADGGFTPHNANTPDPDSYDDNAVNGNANGALSVFAADLDGDGDTDVLSASMYDDRIAWYENGRSPGLVGDLNGDSRVDRADLAILAQNFGPAPDATATQGDLNGDGNVGLQDLAILQANFDAVAPSPSIAAAPAAVSVSAASTSNIRVVAPLAATRRRVDRATAVDRVIANQERLPIAPQGPRILRARRTVVSDPSVNAFWERR